MADKIKRYIDCIIPTQTCNLRCHYCYITQRREFCNKLASFSRTKEYIRKALSRERLGGPCLLNLCAGGETLLSDEVLPIVRELLEEGHYIMVVTNGTPTKRFQEIAQWPPELLQRLVMKFSFHYLELKRLNLLRHYFDNVQLMKGCGVSFTVEITPSDELIGHVDDIKQVCMENLGALCHITIARDDRTSNIDILSKYTLEENKKIWGQFESNLYEFKSSIFYQKRREFCYAGEWSAYLNLDTGDLRQCYCGAHLDNIYEDPDRPILFRAIGCECQLPHCYNGHAFLALGDIPSLETPTYASLRDRACTDGTHWLQPAMAEFMNSKLSESNAEYSILKKGKMTAYRKYRKLYVGLSRIKSRLIAKK